MATTKGQFTATPNAVRVLAGNPGLQFSSAQLGAISAGTLVLRPIDVKGGCIKHLRYQNGDEDLVQITFDDGTVVNTSTVANLNDFRRRLQEAANYGHGVTFCVNTEEREMFMLNIFPCRCTCDKRDA